MRSLAWLREWISISKICIIFISTAHIRSTWKVCWLFCMQLASNSLNINHWNKSHLFFYNILRYRGCKSPKMLHLLTYAIQMTCSQNLLHPFMLAQKKESEKKTQYQWKQRQLVVAVILSQTKLLFARVLVTKAQLIAD